MRFNFAGPHGGKREGAGRKRLIEDDLQERRTIRLSHLDYNKLKLLGGSEWIRFHIGEFVGPFPDFGMAPERVKKKEAEASDR